MNSTERHCFLSDEVSTTSTLKHYSKQNCKYECKVKFALKNCGCIPWDFPLNLNDSVIECDVFGRTCFFNAIKVSMKTVLQYHGVSGENQYIFSSQ